MQNGGLYKLQTEYRLTIHNYIVDQFILPTEFVIYDLSPKLPDIARYYATEFYSRHGYNELMTYDDLRTAVPNFTGIYHCADRVFLLEVFEDHGDDGHVSYKLCGFALVKESDLKVNPYRRYAFEGRDLIREIMDLTVHDRGY